MENRPYLFVYGTLGDPDIFERLLKRQAVYLDAILDNYELLVNIENGYLFASPCPGKKVKGKLVDINPSEFRILDLWEDVPLYTRKQVNVTVNGEPVQSFIYTQDNGHGKPVSEIEPNNKEVVLKELLEFLDWMKKNK